jgi:hypothetical protein
MVCPHCNNLFSPKEVLWTRTLKNGTVNIGEFEKWQIVHWKNGGTKKMHGDSILKPVRRVYKQLQLMEDGMVIGRLTRSHLRYKVLVDVGGMAKEDAEAHVESVKNKMRKRRMINPITGQLDTSQNPLTSEEDFFIGVTKDSKGIVTMTIRRYLYILRQSFQPSPPKTERPLGSSPTAKVAYYLGLS